MVNISGLSKAKVLMALFNNSFQQGMGLLDNNGKNDMTEEVATKIINDMDDRLYFDYLQGRVLKVDITNDEFSEWGYDRDVGPGAAQSVIDKIKNAIRTYDENTNTEC